MLYLRQSKNFKKQVAMTKILNIDGFQITITWKRVNRMNMRIVPPDGDIVMSVPYRTSEKEIEKFVNEKHDWIVKSQEQVRKRAAARPSPSSDAEKARARTALLARVAGRLPAIEQQTGLSCSGYTIRDMHTRWGSCNTKTHHINISLMLANRSDEELDYVLIHELVHTKVPDHGPNFKKYMDELMPNWRQVRSSLRDN